MFSGLNEREKDILDHLKDDPSLSVSQISDLVGVSRVTVRNDLDHLASVGLVFRTRGGVQTAFHPDMLARQKENQDTKKTIAKAAAAMIEDGDTVMIVAGTTTALIGSFLLGKRDVRIVTNSTLLLPYARMNPALHLTLVGGEFRPQAEAIVGPMALTELKQYHVKYAFIGTDGISTESGFTSHLVENAEIIRTMADQSRETIVLSDSTKIGKAGFVKIFPLERVSRLITDKGINENEKKELVKAGINIEIA
jgi:DeoR/GlpR family transcriptional regulator of sugar metabolism